MQWVAHYADGTSLAQFAEDGSERSYYDIDRSKLVAFELSDDTGQYAPFCLHLDPGQRLIYRRRVRQRIGSPPVSVYMVGWQATVAGRNLQAIVYLFPGRIVHLAGAWREGSEWFYSVEPVSGET